jgi:pyruvate kinase
VSVRTARTKLVATIGPASRTPERIGELLEAGVDVCRINFSHGTLEEHAESVARIRAAARANGATPAILGDLCGPKIRLNEVAGGKLILERGAIVRITRGTAPATAQQLTTNFPTLVDEVRPGDRILIDDGLVRLLVTEKRADELEAACTVGGELSGRKGVNFPDTHVSAPALTDKDRRDAAWAAEVGLDFVALSFVRSAADLVQLRAFLDEAGSRAQIVAKIEKREAVAALDEIIAAADAVMVARGDLGVELEVWKVPLVQKDIVRRCRAAGVPVIVATQMLQSMVTTPTPTRAEVSDVANAIYDGVDAVMLSAETAAGAHPALAVDMMQRIAEATEGYLSRYIDPPPREEAPSPQRAAAAVAHAAVAAAERSGARLVVVWSASGATVRRVAQHRLPVPVIGVSNDATVGRQMNLLFGVTPLLVPPADHPGRLAEKLDARLIELGLAKRGDTVVVVTSTRPTEPGTNDTVLVHRVQGVG